MEGHWKLLGGRQREHLKKKIVHSCCLAHAWRQGDISIYIYTYLQLYIIAGTEQLQILAGTTGAFALRRIVNYGWSVRLRVHNRAQLMSGSPRALLRERCSPKSSAPDIWSADTSIHVGVMNKWLLIGIIGGEIIFTDKRSRGFERGYEYTLRHNDLVTPQVQ